MSVIARRRMPRVGRSREVPARLWARLGIGAWEVRLYRFGIECYLGPRRLFLALVAGSDGWGWCVVRSERPSVEELLAAGWKVRRIALETGLSEQRVKELRRAWRSDYDVLERALGRLGRGCERMHAICWNTHVPKERQSHDDRTNSTD